jgi:hypothetical protein
LKDIRLKLFLVVGFIPAAFALRRVVCAVRKDVDVKGKVFLVLN